MVLNQVIIRDGRRAGLGSVSKILNSGFRAGLVFGSGFRVPGRKPGIFWNFFFESKKLLSAGEVGEAENFFL